MLDKPDHSGGQAGARSPLDALRLRLYRGPGWQSAVRSGLARVWSWRKVAALALAALGLLWFVIIPGVLGPVVQGEAVVRADFVQSVVASGHVEAPFRVNIGSQIVGIVADVPVAEGQTVKAGDTLIVLDDRELRAAVVQAEGFVAQAQARVRQMVELTFPSAEEALAQSTATLANAQAAYERTSRLAGTGVATRAALDEATRALAIARAQVRANQYQVYTSRPGGSDYVMAETQLSQARASLATAQSRLGYTVITAPRDGVLISRNVERGNIVQPSSVLMMLSPSGDTQLVVQIDEKNLGSIALGQKALASTDAFPKETFPAEVLYINPGIDLQKASVEVKLRVPDPPAYLRQDMTVSVDIETASRAAAIIAPTKSIRGLNTAQPWVLKVQSGRLARQTVKTGLVSTNKTQILEGLKDGELVLPATSVLKVGARVRARANPNSKP